MPGKVIIELSVPGFKKLASYLDHHEYDIAAHLDDFEELSDLYIAVYDEPARED